MGLLASDSLLPTLSWRLEYLLRWLLLWSLQMAFAGEENLLRVWYCCSLFCPVKKFKVNVARCSAISKKPLSRPFFAELRENIFAALVRKPFDSQDDCKNSLYRSFFLVIRDGNGYPWSSYLENFLSQVSFILRVLHTTTKTRFALTYAW